MKKFALILALCMLLGGCGTEEGGLAGLVTDEVTADPNATRVVSPLFADDTHGTNAPSSGVTAPPETEPPKPKETRITKMSSSMRNPARRTARPTISSICTTASPT